MKYGLAARTRGAFRLRQGARLQNWQTNRTVIGFLVYRLYSAAGISNMPFADNFFRSKIHPDAVLIVKRLLWQATDLCRGDRTVLYRRMALYCVNDALLLYASRAEARNCGKKHFEKVKHAYLSAVFSFQIISDTKNSRLDYPDDLF